MCGATPPGPGFRAGLFLVLAIVALTCTAQARLDDREALRISQAAIGRTLGGYTFTTSEQAPLSFEQLRGRPVLLSLVYTSCYYVCPSLTLQLREAVKVARATLGANSFSVVTVGFDTGNDTPERMGAFARERGVVMPGWYFASADAATMARLVRDTGFTFFASPKGFDHITQTTVVDAEGRIVLQVYGSDFAAPAVVEPLKKLVWGRNLERGTVEGIVNRVRLFCTIYDPTSGRYRFDYSLVVEIVAGALALGMAAVGIVSSLRNVR